MTITSIRSERVDFQLPTFDLYRNIHKAIRSELFSLTEEAGRLDPDVQEDRAALLRHVDAAVAMLVTHAAHEDGAIQPALEENLAMLADQIESDHETLERRLQLLQELGHDSLEATPSTRRSAVHRLYLELGSFTSAYLEHQDIEERVVMPALELAVGVDAVVAMHHSILANIPPDELLRSLATMLPALNIDDRAEMLGAIQGAAPAEAFGAVWSLAQSVLVPADRRALAHRLGVS